MMRPAGIIALGVLVATLAAVAAVFMELHRQRGEARAQHRELRRQTASLHDGLDDVHVHIDELYGYLGLPVRVPSTPGKDEPPTQRHLRIVRGPAGLGLAGFLLVRLWDRHPATAATTAAVIATAAVGTLLWAVAPSQPDVVATAPPTRTRTITRTVTHTTTVGGSRGAGAPPAQAASGPTSTPGAQPAVMVPPDETRPTSQAMSTETPTVTSTSPIGSPPPTTTGRAPPTATRPGLSLCLSATVLVVSLRVLCQ
jgi:hypothetical protein